MAENIVAGLFGLTPQMYGEQQRRSALQEGIDLAQLDPASRGAAMTYAGARGLGGAIAGAMGIEDPQLKLITQRQQLLGMIDPSNPDSYIQAAQMALQSGDAEAAYALREQGTQARMQAMKNEDYLTQRGQRMQTQGLEGIAQNLITQLKNPDGSVNEEVKKKLLSFPQGLKHLIPLGHRHFLMPFFARKIKMRESMAAIARLAKEQGVRIEVKLTSQPLTTENVGGFLGAGLARGATAVIFPQWTDFMPAIAYLAARGLEFPRDLSVVALVGNATTRVYVPPVACCLSSPDSIAQQAEIWARSQKVEDEVYISVYQQTWQAGASTGPVPKG